MSFRNELFRPGGQNLAWKFVLRKEAEKFVLFWGLIFWGQNCAWGPNHNQDEINVLMTWLSNNFRRDINCIHFGFGFFAFSNWSCKTTSSVKKALQKGQCKGQLLGHKIVELATPNFCSIFNGKTWFESAYIPANSILSIFSLCNKIVWIHIFSRNGWTECVLQRTFCLSISQECVWSLNP